MNYIQNITKEIKAYYILKADNPNVSLPIDGTEVITVDWYVIHLIDRPIYDTDTEKIIEIEPEQISSTYFQVWDVVPLTEQEKDDNLSVAQNNKYSQIWAEYERLIKEVENMGVQGRDPQKGRKLGEKSNKRLTKKSKDQSLSPTEEEDEEWYDNFMDWSDNNHDAANSACDDVELMETPTEINAYNAITGPDWVLYAAS